jgi:hypothetical protein
VGQILSPFDDGFVNFAALCRATFLFAAFCRILPHFVARHSYLPHFAAFVPLCREKSVGNHILSIFAAAVQMRLISDIHNTMAY